MSASLELGLFLVALLVQIAGLASTALARLSWGRRRQRACQGLFLCCLLAVGLFGMTSIGWPTPYCFSCGATAALMAVGATLDLRSSRREAY